MLTEINHATRKFPLDPISFHNFSNGPLLIFSFFFLLLASVARGKALRFPITIRSQVIGITNK